MDKVHVFPLLKVARHCYPKNEEEARKSLAFALHTFLKFPYQV